MCHAGHILPSGSLSGSRIRSKFGSVWRTHRWFVVGGQPTAALAIMCTTVSRAAWLYNVSSFTLRASSRTSVMLSSSSHLAPFFSSTRSSCPCRRVAVSYKPGRICAQLPLFVPQFHLRRFPALPSCFYRLRISFFLVDSLIISVEW